MEDMNNTDRLVPLDARSADRVVRLRCAHSPDCPVADLPGLLMEFPNEVLRNPALMLAAAADPGLMLNWPDYAVGIVACSSEAALAAPALKRESAARDFAMWWSSRGLEPFVAGKHEYAYGSLAGSLALEEEREMRALRHLLAVSGISAATIDFETGERKGARWSFKASATGDWSHVDSGLDDELGTPELLMLHLREVEHIAICNFAEDGECYLTAERNEDVMIFDVGPGSDPAKRLFWANQVFGPGELPLPVDGVHRWLEALGQIRDVLAGRILAGITFFDGEFHAVCETPDASQEVTALLVAENFTIYSGELEGEDFELERIDDQSGAESLIEAAKRLVMIDSCARAGEFPRLEGKPSCALVFTDGILTFALGADALWILDQTEVFRLGADVAAA